MNPEKNVNLSEQEELEFMEAEATFLAKRIEEKKASIAESQAKIQADVDTEIADLREEYFKEVDGTDNQFYA